MSEDKEIVVEEVKEDKPKKKLTTEDKLKALLDDQYARIEQMVDDKFKKMDLRMNGKLEYSQLRIWKSFEAEFKRYSQGYFNEFQ